MARKRKNQKEPLPDDVARDENERSHPVGVGIGAAGGATTGAAIGAVGGPVGAAVGAAVGGVAGGLAGRAVAQSINPKEEDAYWRENFASRPYVDRDADYSTYEPAYRYGWEATSRHEGRSFDEAESDLQRDWDRVRGESSLEWDRARHAARDAWQRVRRDDSVSHHDLASADRDRGFEEEDRYWREQYSSRPYVAQGVGYEEYAPAYRFGSESRTRYAGRSFDEAERDLERDWERRHGTSSLSWQNAKEAVRDAWHRVERALPGDADRDGR